MKYIFRLTRYRSNWSSVVFLCSQGLNSVCQSTPLGVYSIQRVSVCACKCKVSREKSFYV